MALCFITWCVFPFVRTGTGCFYRVEKGRAPLAFEREQTPRIVFKASPAASKVWVHAAGTLHALSCNPWLIADYLKLGKGAWNICALGFYGLTGGGEQHY